MDSQEKNDTLRSSEHLYAKVPELSVKSEVEQEGGPTDVKKHPQELKNQRWRLHVPHECKQPLDALRRNLELKSTREAVGWIFPSETKRLIELTRELGYEKGGQTIDRLLQTQNNHVVSRTRELGFQTGRETLNSLVPTQTNRLEELTRQLGYRTGGQTIDHLISMATKPMLQLNRLLGSEGSAKAIEWLLTQLRIATVKNETQPTLSSTMNKHAQFRQEQFQTPTFQQPGRARDPVSASELQSFVKEHILQLPAFNTSLGNHSVPPGLLPTEFSGPDRNASGSQSHGSETRRDYEFPSAVSVQSQHQFENSVHMVGEKQQRNQFNRNSNGFQGGQATNQNFDKNEAFANLSNNFKRRRLEGGHSHHRINQLQTLGIDERRKTQAINLASETVPTQTLSQKGFDAVDARYDEGYPSRYMLGMPIQIQIHNNILPGDVVQENHGNQYFDPAAMNQVFNEASMTPGINQGIATQNEFDNVKIEGIIQGMAAQNEFENMMTPAVKNEFDNVKTDGIIRGIVTQNEFENMMTPTMNKGIAAHNEFENMMTPTINFQGTAPQIEFENIEGGNQYQNIEDCNQYHYHQYQNTQDCNQYQYQNEGETEMQPLNGRQGRPPSVKQENYEGMLNTFGMDKSP